MNYSEVAVFIIYFLAMLGIGVYFFFRSRGGEKEYFLGSRQMGPWVSALSTGASDMSAWALMGLPASIYAAGMGRTWIAIGLTIGCALNWILLAPRLRRFSIAADDAITVPQYLANRFLTGSKALQFICAAIFLVAYTIYAASSIKACGILFNTVLGVNASITMYASAFIIVAYTFLGGFKAVCWTDFYQALLILAALLVAPIFALAMVNSGAGAAAGAGGSNGSLVFPENYWSLLSSGKPDWKSWSDIISGLGWGLGHFGMPHIIIRFMAIRTQREVKKSAAIGITWNVLILGFSVAVGCVGRMFLGEIQDGSLVFITMVRVIFPALISGLLLSAILAAAMSTADSQLLSSASAFVADVYKPVFRKGAKDAEMLWAGRFIVIAISVAAVLIAANPNSGTIMELVENAWGVFGAAFGPVILLSLFWRRFTIAGAVSGIIAGAAADILWLAFLSGTGLYEIVPGFAAGTLAAITATLSGRRPGKDVEALYDRSVLLGD